MARIAKSLDVLRGQIDQRYPNRSKVSDGWIGDPAHAARDSDHNPDDDGVVKALDITHDLVNGPDTWAMAETLRKNRDRRIKYVISNGRAFVGNHGTWNGNNVGAWTWFKYTGANNHAKHVHVSVLGEAAIYDASESWNLDLRGTILPAPTPPKPKGVTEDMRRRMMEVILTYEGRFVGGKLQVHIATDGLPEIGGITQKDHPAAYAHLKQLLDLGMQDKLKDEVLAYYDQYTDPAQNWTDRAGVEFFLRDCILNRGPTGAAEILQLAVGVEIDGQVGPTTRAALAALNPNVAIDKLRVARESYELATYGRRAALWQGLINRWNKAQAQAKAFQREQGTAGLDTAITTGVIVVGTGTVAAVKQNTWTWVDLGMAGFSVGIAALVVFFIVRSIRRRS